jgi:hypothetical protein
VEYDIEREVTMLLQMQFPYAACLADMLRKGDIRAATGVIVTRLLLNGLTHLS